MTPRCRVCGPPWLTLICARSPPPRLFSTSWKRLDVRPPERLDRTRISAWRSESIFDPELRADANSGQRLVPRGKRVVTHVAIEAVETPTANAHAEDRVHLAELVEGLKAIHPRKRRMLVLHGAGFTYEEIARKYGVSIERARELVYRAVSLRDRGDCDNAAPRVEATNRRRRDLTRA